ncbi:MAG: ATP-dependent helicase [Anaerolineaceae bacterium]|nr:ATP-dependent helicase [Anaerolineaceae bacterium]
MTIFPATKSNSTPEDIEEECRLLYVSMTRAKKALHVYFSNAEFNRQYGMVTDMVPSRFIAEFPEVTAAVKEVEEES